jgi:transcription elongation factor Elf1
MAPDPNTLRRTDPCPECGEMMLWTQNAWASGDNRAAAYCCLNGHVVDPVETRECPTCGVHDTRRVLPDGAGQVAHTCNQCGAQFSVPN